MGAWNAWPGTVVEAVTFNYSLDKQMPMQGIEGFGSYANGGG